MGSPSLNSRLGYPDDARVLDAVECVWEELPGWRTTLRNCRRDADLPEQVRRLLAIVEEHVGVPVSIVGVGPERDDCVVRS
jgi:adenylosuccinate synthase